MRTHPARTRRAGQAAVETLIAMPVGILLVVALYQLWGLTFAAQNCHLRAREAILHGKSTYLRGKRATEISGFAPFSGRNYLPAVSKDFYFTMRAEDWTIPGVGEPERIRSTAVIVSR